jgi:hypothetical protein
MQDEKGGKIKCEIKKYIKRKSDTGGERERTKENRNREKKQASHRMKKKKENE